MTLKNILVPVDFSEFSDNALEYACLIAEKYGADLTILHTVLLFDENIDEKEDLLAHEKIMKRKEKVGSRKLGVYSKNAENCGLHVRTVLLRAYSAADSIVEYITDNHYDLVVIGTHGHTDLKEWMLGSVTEKVVRFSPIPVLTIHKEFNKKTIEKILLPVDFSEISKLAVDKGIKIAGEINADIHFIHVVETDTHPQFYAKRSDTAATLTPELKRSIITKLEAFTTIPQQETTYVVTEGRVHLEIKKYADANAIDLIVMSTGGMGAMERFLLGSNTERMVRIASCPVLTVK